MPPHLSFVQISDSHLGPTRDYDYHGANPARALQRLVRHINAMPHPPDFVLHTGDVSNDGSAASYEIAAAILGELAVPLYILNGNHDDRLFLRKALDAPPAPDGDPGGPLDYTFEVGGEQFVVLDSFDEAVQQPLGRLSPAQIEWARAQAAPDGPPLTVCLHHPPFRMASPWLDDNMILLNGDALHAALLPARDRLRAVFFGHLHRGAQIVRDGITYVCAAGTAWQYHWRAWDERPVPDMAFETGYNLVHYLPGQAVVMQHVLGDGD